jgi:penicillin-binding protein 2
MNDSRVRVRIFIGMIVLVLSAIAGRLVQMQLFNTEQYAGKTRGNAVEEQRVTPARGAILDRNGNVILDNESSYTIAITPRYFQEDKTDELADLMEVSDSVVTAKLEAAREHSPYQASAAFTEVPFQKFSRVQEQTFRLPGVSYEIEQKRRFQSNARAAHAMGYIREISEAELKRLRDQGYRQGDLIGKTGLEKRYEPYLRGKMGSEFRMVNVHGRDVEAYKGGAEDVQPTSGYNLHTGLDRGTQALAESLFVNKRGGAVAVDPDNGEIIALVSSPDYNPETFTKSIPQKRWKYLTESPVKPMYNRATLMQKPPGSSWKPFMALMALQENLISKNETYNCPGYHPFGGPSIFQCMHVHGSISVVPAIQHSCNTFFFEMMSRSNLHMYKKYARMFGFDMKPAVDVGEQSAGLIPDSSYFNRKAGGPDKWGLGFTMSLGIGQGDIGVTPLQLASYMMVVANKGTRYPLHMVRKFVRPSTGETRNPSLPEPEKVPIDEKNFDIVQEGMKLVMEAGTGVHVQIPGIKSGGKTGTAQNPHGEDHSVFVLFAPVEDPEIAIGVIAENAGYGSTAAGSIASLMAEKFLRGKLSDTPETQKRMRMALNARSEPTKAMREASYTPPEGIDPY